jgi:hypothetical protein
MKISLTKSLLGLFAVTLATGGMYWQHKNATLSPEQRYKLQPIERGEITQTVSANGTLNPVVLVNVGTQVSGTVTRLYVDFNDKVEKGQALLELDDSLLAAQARQSAANVRNVSAALDLARANEARMRALFAQEYVSRQEFEQVDPDAPLVRGAVGAGQGSGRQGSGQSPLHHDSLAGLRRRRRPRRRPGPDGRRQPADADADQDCPGSVRNAHRFELRRSRHRQDP